MFEHRYNTFSTELRNVFGCRVQRISVDAGLTCPNRDGTVGTGGCIFCGGEGSGAKGIVRNLPIPEQIQLGKRVMVSKFKATKFLAYFQPYSNTYAPVAHLRKLYDEALSVVDVVGLVIGTRPDCLSDDVIELLAEYSDKTYLWVEIGLQSSVNRTLKAINRGHDTDCFADAVRRCNAHGIRVCGHIIFGLPGESRQEMLASADFLNKIGVKGVKLHHLHVMKATVMEELYLQGKLPLLEKDDYISLVSDFLERIDPEMLVMRLVGDGGHNLVAPRWGTSKFAILNAIDNELMRRGTRQGSLLERVP